MSEIIYGVDRITNEQDRIAFIASKEIILQALKTAEFKKDLKAFSYLCHVELLLQERCHQKPSVTIEAQTSEFTRNLQNLTGQLADIHPADGSLCSDFAFDGFEYNCTECGQEHGCDDDCRSYGCKANR